MRIRTRKAKKSPGWGEPGSLLGCIGRDGGIAAYANDQHRRIVDAIGLSRAHRGGRDRARHFWRLQ